MKSSANAMAPDLLLSSKVCNELYSMFQNPGPEQLPWGKTLVICLSMVKLFVFIIAVLLLKNSLLRMYRFLGQLKSLRHCNIAGHHADSKAPWTSKLAIIASPLFSSIRWMNYLASIAASIVFFRSETVLSLRK